MSRTIERHGTKSSWRLGLTRTYGIAARRRAQKSVARALAEHEAAVEGRSK